MQQIKTSYGFAILSICLLLSVFLINQAQERFDSLTLSVLPSSQTASVSGPGSGLVAHWTFDEGSGNTAGDSSGNNKTGTLINGPMWVEGKVGSGAVSFDGKDDSILTTLDLDGSKLFSISLWVKPNDVASTERHLFTCGQDQQIYKTNDDLWYKTNRDTTVASNVLSSNTWSHVVVIFDGATVKIYADGTLIITETKSAIDSVGSCVIGSLGTTGTNFRFTGVLDDIRVYNRALSADEVSELYSLYSDTVVSSANGSCGSASKTYTSTETFPGGSYCSSGTPNPETPANPQPGNSSSWTCESSSGGSAASCQATRQQAGATVYTLTVSKGGIGSGTITGGSINCGSTCTQSNITSGTSITLSAAPQTNSVFAGWSGGGCSGTGNCTVTVNANTAVTATFNVQQTSGPKTYNVRQDGTGDFTTIQACANVAKAGDTCLVYPGTYPEHVVTKSGGTSSNQASCTPFSGTFPNYTINSSCDAQRVNFKAVGKVTMQGFNILHPFITVDGFDITGYTSKYSTHIAISKDGNYCQIKNNVIRDGANDVFGIQFYSSNNLRASNCLIRGNTLSNLNYHFLTVAGNNHLVEENIFEYQNNMDYLRVFGHDHLIRKNIFRKGYAKAGVGNHPDLVQTFGDNGYEAYHVVFEENWIQDLESQIAMMTQDGYSDFRDWVFRKNVFVNVSNNGMFVISGVKIIGNTFYRIAYTQFGISIGSTLNVGNSFGAVIKDNVFLESGEKADEANSLRGFYMFNGVPLSLKFVITDNALVASIASDLVKNGYLYNTNGHLTDKARALTDISQCVISSGFESYRVAVCNILIKTAAADVHARNTFFGDYNFAAGAKSTGFLPKRNSTCNSPSTLERSFNFCDAHGINGGDPKFQNISNPLGSDGIPFTLDDGLKPLPGSPLCGKGDGGVDIGAYSCDPAKVFVNGSVVNTSYPPATCSVFTYSSWSTCVNGTQIRTVTSSSPFGCTGGNPITTQTCTVVSTPTPDITPPTITLTAPTFGATLNPSSIRVSASASDPIVSGETTSGVVSVQFKINGQNLGVADTVSPYFTDWNALTLPDGSYTLTAVARDEAGNTTISAPVTVTLSTPVVADTDSDDDGVENSLDLCPNTPTNLVSITPSIINARGCPLPIMSTFSIKPILTNSDLKNVSPSSLPSKTIDFGNSYAKVSYSSGSIVLVKNVGNYHDRLDIDAHLKISQGSISLDSSSLPELNKPARLTFFNVPTPNPKILKDGAICSTCTGASYDATTHTFSFSVTGFSTFTLDFTPDPDVTAPSVVNDNTPSSLPAGTTNTTLSVTTDEEATCKYSTTTNVSYSSMAGSFTTTNNLSHTYTVTGLTNGNSYSYSVRCQDTAGNATTTDLTLSFSVANSVTPPPPSGGGSISGGGVSYIPDQCSNIAGMQYSVPTGYSRDSLGNCSLRTATVSIVTTPTPAETPRSFPSVTKWLTLGMFSPEVKILQQILNALDYVVSPSGAGSKGQETSYFGPATEKAVRSFQCKVLSVCSGTPTSTGYGATGPKTRAALNSQASTLTTYNATTTVISPPISIPITKYTFTRSLKQGDTGQDVKTLQQFLNSNGFIVSQSGPGSIGNETTYFGPATKSAVIRFQNAYKDKILTPLGLTQGTGFFGESTRRMVEGM